MTKRLYLDESGECSFAQSSNFKHFLITILSVDSSENEIIKTYLKRKFAKFIKKGWIKTREIKASSLFNYKKFGSESIKEVVQYL